METMKDFHKWLNSAGELPSPDLYRLTALTRLSRAQLADVSGQSTWFIWHDDEPEPESVKQ